MWMWIGMVIGFAAAMTLVVICGVIAVSKSDKEADKRFYAIQDINVRLWKGQLRIIHAQNRIATALEKLATPSAMTSDKDQLRRFIGASQELVSYLELSHIGDPCIAGRVSIVREEMRELMQMVKTPIDQQMDEIQKRVQAEMSLPPRVFGAKP